MDPLSQKPAFILPDLLQKHLTLVFCGTAAGNLSAARGHYYAHPQNKFWRTLYRVGLTPRLLSPSEFRHLTHYKIGLTDIAKTVSGTDKELPSGSLGHIACEALRARIEEFQPDILAFTSLTAGQKFLSHSARVGPQIEKVGRTKIWILPSPSPIAHWNWDESLWKKLAITTNRLRNKTEQL